MRDPPSGRVREQGPNWFLVATEACGGGTPDLGFFLEGSVFVRLDGVEDKQELRLGMLDTSPTYL